MNNQQKRQAIRGMLIACMIGDSRENMYHNKVGGNVPSWFDKLTTNGTEGSYKP